MRFACRTEAFIACSVVFAIQCAIGLGLPPIDGSVWDESMYPVIGSESSGRNVGQMVRFPHNQVFVEGHNVFAKDEMITMNQTVMTQYESFDVTPYMYVEARGEWLRLSETFHRPLLPRKTAMFDATFCSDIEVKSIDVRHHMVAFLDESSKFDDKMEDFVRMQRTISLYAIRYGTWEAQGVLKGPVMDISAKPIFWGADFALSAQGKTLAVSVMDGKDVGKIHLHHINVQARSDPFEEIARPLEGSSLGFGYRVQINEIGDIVAGVGCESNDTTHDDEVKCYFQAFQKSSSLAQQDRDKNLWLNMGDKVDCSDMKLLPEDSFVMDSGGKAIVLGTIDVDKGCPISKQGGKVRVYEYDQGKKLWLRKGQDLDSLFDFSTADEYYSILPTSITDHGGLITLYANWVDKMLGKQSLLFTCQFQQGQWVLMGRPVHVGDFGQASLSPDGGNLVVGAQFDARYLGSLRLFDRYHDDDSKVGYTPPAAPHRPVSTISRYAKTLQRGHRPNVPGRLRPSR